MKQKPMCTDEVGENVKRQVRSLHPRLLQERVVCKWVADYMIGEVRGQVRESC